MVIRLLGERETRGTQDLVLVCSLAVVEMCCVILDVDFVHATSTNVYVGRDMFN